MEKQEKSTEGELSRIDSALRANFVGTLALIKEFLVAHPNNIDGLIFLGRAHQVRAQFSEMLQAAKRVEAIDPRNPIGRILMIEALLRCGQSETAFQAARKLEVEKKFDPIILSQLGNFYSETNLHADAARCFERVRILQPTNIRALYSLAGSHVALGELDKTERLFDTLLRRSPHEYDAYYNRSTLRKQKPGANHVADMEALLKEPLRSETAEPILCYSLAKELEDLGEWNRSFSYLKRGADARRRTMSYNVDEDLAMLEDIGKRFDRSFFQEHRSGYGEQRPIFVLGMPRSGTTLVDRILSSHSGVGSVGELSEFSMAVLRQAGGQNGRGNIGLERVREFNYELMGKEYCESLNAYLPGTTHILDKTPNNFYYIGMIATALPNAPIIHLRRNPVATCYAIYKTLFRAGYSYSYNLSDMGRYYLGYLKLMEHWRRVLPGRFLDVDYELLVADQEGVSRQMLEFCGLEWEAACLSFEKNDSPSLTASAAQVRQPIYDSSVGLWRRYEKELAPLIRIFQDAGIAVD